MPTEVETAYREAQAEAEEAHLRMVEAKRVYDAEQEQKRQDTMNGMYDVEDVLPLFEKAVKERGADFLYPKDDPDWVDDDGQCRYFLENGTPACIVGVVLYKLGVSPDVVFEGQGADLQPIVSTHFTDQAKFLAERAQSYQDNRSPWGEAVMLAKRDLERYADEDPVLL